IRYYRRHLDLLSIPELVAGLDDPATLPERPALITFDDGYSDNYEYALPILKEQGVTACFFLATHFLESSRIPWWDYAACCLKHSRVESIPSPFGGDDPPYQPHSAGRAKTIRRFLHRLIDAPWEKVDTCLERLSEFTGVDPEAYRDRSFFMTWEQARRMQEMRMDLGGHTRTHPVLGRVNDPAFLREEIQGCFDDLLAQTGMPPLAFAYPVGHEGAMSPEADAEIRRAGFKVHFSFLQASTQLERLGNPPYPRIAAEYQDNFQAFRMGMMRNAR
ncbi:MAG: polysaccharide deacetylase family protein, partial [Armatimonadetes bacterium]|nr:polysaccharide deacetylase family protein [Armatimonadota bacterium]